MLKLQRDKQGPYVQFVDPGGKRRKLRLTGNSERDSKRFVEKLEQLRSIKRLGLPLDDHLQRWAASLPQIAYDRLASYDLLPRRTEAAGGGGPETLKAFLDSYSATRSDVKSATSAFYGHTKRNLIEFYGGARTLASVTPGSADEFFLWLRRSKEKGSTVGQGLSESTANRRCRLAFQFFRAAMRKGLIASNPFEGVGGVVKSNKSRLHFVTRDEATKVLESCPDAEWKLIFSLSRFGGLRTPSEHFGLLLDDIDWARDRFLVRSPKTERHSGGDQRWVPIFPELRAHLLHASETAREGERHVVRRYRNQANLRTRFEKIISRAGVTPWPKLFQNLRSTRQTELAAEHPLHVVCAWLGNKAAIAAEHYLQVTDADFAKAAAAQGAFQGQPCTESTGTDGRHLGDDATVSAEISQNTANQEDVEWATQDSKVLARYSEIVSGGGAQGRSRVQSAVDARLQSIIDLWPRLDSISRRAVAGYAASKLKTQER